jgi:hypothetical protein
MTKAKMLEKLEWELKLSLDSKWRNALLQKNQQEKDKMSYFYIGETHVLKMLIWNFKSKKYACELYEKLYSEAYNAASLARDRGEFI